MGTGEKLADVTRMIQSIDEQLTGWLVTSRRQYTRHSKQIRTVLDYHLDRRLEWMDELAESTAPVEQPADPAATSA